MGQQNKRKESQQNDVDHEEDDNSSKQQTPSKISEQEILCQKINNMNESFTTFEIDQNEVSETIKLRDDQKKNKKNAKNKGRIGEQFGDQNKITSFLRKQSIKLRKMVYEQVLGKTWLPYYNFFMNFICAPIILVLIFYIYEFKIVKKCTQYRSEEECVDKLVLTQLETLIGKIFIQSLLNYALVYLALKKYVPRFYLVPFGLYYFWCFVINGSLSFNKITGYDWTGAYFYVMIVFGFLFTIPHKIASIWIHLYAVNQKKFILVFFASGVAFLCVNTYLIGTCKNWDNGIAGYIEKDGGHCNLLEPYICWQSAFDKWLLFERSCGIDNLVGQKQSMLQLYDKINPLVQTREEIDQVMNQYNYMAYPMTSKFDEEQKDLEYQTQQSIINESLFSEDFETVRDSGREAIVDLNTMQLSFQMQRDEQLVKNRKQIYDSQEHLAKNVIFIYIDTLSRPQAHRKLPKTMEFLYQFTDYDKKTRSYTKEANNSAKIYEFFRFHSIDRMTRNNSFKLQYNTTKEHLNEFTDQTEPQPNLLGEYKKRGYITGHSTNTCTSQCSFRKQYKEYKQYFSEDSGDHEFLMYDPQYMDPDNYYNLKQGINSMFRRCIFGTDTSDHVINYGYKFLETYRNDPKFLYLEFTDSHEVTSEVVSYLDNHLYNFFVNIQALGYLDKDTNIVLLSDHGQHIINSFLYQYENTDLNPTNSFHQIERMLPLYMTLFTSDILNKYPELDENLFNNQQYLIGMQQVRNTIVTTSDGFQNPNIYNDSVLVNRQDNKMLCQNMGFAQIDTVKWCMCKNPDLEEAKIYLDKWKIDQQKILEGNM